MSEGVPRPPDEAGRFSIVDFLSIFHPLNPLPGLITALCLAGPRRHYLCPTPMQVTLFGQGYDGRIVDRLGSRKNPNTQISNSRQYQIPDDNVQTVVL